MGMGVCFIEWEYDNEAIKANPIKKTQENKCMWTNGSHYKETQE